MTKYLTFFKLFDLVVCVLFIASFDHSILLWVFTGLGGHNVQEAREDVSDCFIWFPELSPHLSVFVILSLSVSRECLDSFSRLRRFGYVFAFWTPWEICFNASGLGEEKNIGWGCFSFYHQYCFHIVSENQTRPSTTEIETKYVIRKSRVFLAQMGLNPINYLRKNQVK